MNEIWWECCGVRYPYLTFRCRKCGKTTKEALRDAEPNRTTR